MTHSLRLPARVLLLSLLVGTAFAMSGTVSAPRPAAAAGIAFATQATNLTAPIYVTSNGDSRLFIVQQDGVIKVRNGSTGQVTNFLDIRSLVQYSGERGLLSMAFHPDFRKDPAVYFGANRFYVNYVDNNGNIQLDEYRVTSPSANTASTATRRALLTIPHPTNTNHNGGLVAFGPDGYLYLSTGDGGGSGDPGENAQNLNRLLGKMLRINPYDRYPGSGLNYSIPPGNPFAGAVSGRDEIWAWGLRNPWRYSFDRKYGHLWIGDVGQDRYEEIDKSLADSAHKNAGRRLNYGWDIYEGYACFEGCTSSTASGKAWPHYVYAHSGLGGGNCSITGGYVHNRGDSLYRKYIFGDFCTGRIWYVNGDSSVRPTAHLLYDYADGVLVSFGEDYLGNLYLVDHSGTVRRVIIP